MLSILYKVLPAKILCLIHQAAAIDDLPFLVSTSLPPSHAQGSVTSTSKIGYQLADLSQFAIAPSAANTVPIIPSMMACRMGALGANFAVR